MTANGTLFVAHCPLKAFKMCSWESEPQTIEAAAHEQLRAHLGGSAKDAHSHGDLVRFAAAHMDTITKYHKEQPPQQQT